ncbi:unnamed protein product, partial [Pleuronectes platessa]
RLTASLVRELSFSWAAVRRWGPVGGDRVRRSAPANLDACQALLADHLSYGARWGNHPIRQLSDNKRESVGKNAAEQQNSSDQEDSEASLHHLHRDLNSSADVADSQSELILLLTALRAVDLKIAPRKSKPCSGAAGLQSPPVTYMHICETEVFSMGVFLLRPGASILLHDHPDMNGNLRSC